MAHQAPGNFNVVPVRLVLGATWLLDTALTENFFDKIQEMLFMSNVLITTVPFGDENRLPIEQLESAGIEYLINPIGRKLKEEELVEIKSHPTPGLFFIQGHI